MPDGTRRDRLGRVRRPEQDVFQPLDPDSPSVVMRVRVPQSLLHHVDDAALTQGVTRLKAVRDAINKWLTHEA